MKRRTQYQIMVAFMDDMYFVENDLRTHLDVTMSHLFPMSENHVFRNNDFVKTVNVINEEGKLESTHYGKFIVLRNDRRQVDLSSDLRPEHLLKHGVVLHFDEELTAIFGYDHMEYKRALRSASQFRTAKLLATEAGLVDAVRSHASYGWIDQLEGKLFKTVAKVEPYIGLALSSSVPAGKGYSDVNISDYVSTVDITGALTMDDSTGKNVIIRYDEFMKNNTADMELTDGEALISPRALAKAAFEAGIIFKSEYKSLKLAFEEGCSYAEQMTYELSLAPIWKKIPRAIQFRYGLKKGLFIMVDHDYVNAYGKQFDFVFPDGANKGEVKRFENRFENGKLSVIDHGAGVSDRDVELCIANVSSVKEKYWGMLNYQFIMSLGIDFKTGIMPLAVKAFKRLMTALDSPENAMAFIGMIDNGDEDRYEEQLTAVGKIRELLSANPRIFYTKWMKTKIKDLMKKTVEDMRRGRIPVEDSRFVFIVTDPNTLLADGAPLLKKGEFYYNGEVGERAIFRSPLIHKSEAVVVNLVNRPELNEAFGHLTNVLIFNAFDDALPRMGGADCDGDKVYLTSEAIIIQSVERDQPMIYGDVETKSFVPFAWTDGAKEKIKEYDMRTLLPSQIGKITNYCSAHVDTALDLRTTPEDSKAKWEMVILGRILQGKIIDDAKRGHSTTIDKRLEVEVYPQWLEAGKSREKTWSPMGRLYRWVQDHLLAVFAETIKEERPYTENILMDYKEYSPLIVNEILPKIADLEKSYRQDVADFFEKNGQELNPDNFDSVDEYREEKEKRSQYFEALIKHHQDLLATLKAPTAAIGLACMHVAENLQRSGEKKLASYPYVIGTDYIVALLAGLPNNFKLVRAYEVDGALWTTSVVVQDNIIYNEDGAQVGITKETENGVYGTHTYRDGFYLKVNYVRQTEEVARIEEERVQFELKGFKSVAKMTDSEVIQLINHQSISLQKIENERGNWLGVMFQGKQIGAVGKETFLDANFAQGKTLTVISLQPIKGIIKITAKIEAEVPVSVHVEEAPVQESTIVLGYDQMDMFDTTIGM